MPPVIRDDSSYRRGDRKEAEKIACLSSNVFRVWLKRFNEGDVSGLCHKARTGRPSKLSSCIKEALRQKVLAGPSREEGLVRYRLVDLQTYLQETHGVRMAISKIWSHLQGLGLSWKTGRQRHPKSDAAAQNTFKKTLSTT